MKLLLRGCKLGIGRASELEKNDYLIIGKVKRNLGVIAITSQEELDELPQPWL